MMGPIRISSSSRPLRANHRIAAVLVLAIFVAIGVVYGDRRYIKKSSIYQLYKNSGDGGRFLRSTFATQAALVDGPEGQLLTASNAYTSGDDAPTLAQQDSLIKAAVDYVKSVAVSEDSDGWLATIDPDSEAARIEALHEMMGVKAIGPDGHSNFRDVSMHRARRAKDIIEAIRGCQTFECLQMAHTRPPGPAKYNFPHFIMIGWQKTATTSIFAHLNFHPEISRPWDKEPEFFSNTCNYDVPAGCRDNDTYDYIHRVLRVSRYTGYDGQKAQYEASTHYSRMGHKIAAGIYEMLPWVKIVASLRDPISRAASMLVHLLDKNVNEGGCLAAFDKDLGYCLLTDSHINSSDVELPSEYYYPLKAWVDAFPRDQIILLQYEMLTALEGEKAELVRLKNFLGIDPTLPGEPHVTLGMNNARKGRINPDGWPMKRDVYQQLVDMVRPDCEAVARLVTKKGFGDGAVWMENWEQVWRDNLKSCDANGDCIIQLS